MTARQMEREVKRAAVDFEREIELGYQADNRQTFAQYAEYFMRLREQNGAARRTIEGYEYLMERIDPILGAMKLQEIRPQHLNAFYQKLGQPGSANKNYKAIPKIDIKKFLNEQKMTQNALVAANHMGTGTVTRMCRGQTVSLKVAGNMANFFGKPVDTMFKIEKGTTPLSKATIRRYHNFISAVLGQAEKEMLIPYNPAKKATAPIRREYTPNYFQPETLVQILEAAEEEPMNWKTIINLLAVTGCRLGELMGLKWEKVDFRNRQIKIDRSLHYTPKSGIFEGPTKTKNARYITIPTETLTLLKKYRAWQAEQRLKMGDAWHETGYLFTKDNGEPVIPSAVGTWLNRFGERHGPPAH